MTSKKDTQVVDRQIPLYRKIEQELRKKIAGGDWPAGTVIPSRQALTKQYQVNLATVQQAVGGLLEDGTLRAEGARGTFVADADAGFTEQEGFTEPGAGRRSRSVGRLDTARKLAAPKITLGVVAQDLHGSDIPSPGTDVWLHTIFRAMEGSVLEGEGAVHLVDRAGDGTRPELSDAEAVRALVDEGVNAVAMINLYGDPHPEQEILRAAGSVPVVSISFDPGCCAELPLVYYDSAYAGYQAAQHLIHQGCRDLLLVAPYSFRWVEARIAAARRAVSKAGLPEESLHVYPEKRGYVPSRLPNRADQTKIATETMQAALAEGYQFTGLIAINDIIAAAARQTASDTGLVAGKDYGLIGFDDMLISAELQISTMRPPLEALGQEAVRLLTRLLQGEKTVSQVHLRSRVIQRASSRLPVRKG